MTENRVVLHFDVDAFYVACEREINASLRNVPVAVSQYNPYGNLRQTSISDPSRLVACPNLGKTTGTYIHSPSRKSSGSSADDNGSLIAVSYEARAAGVRRNDRGQEAVRKCPNLHIMQVPIKRSKADLSLYRDASQRVMKSLVGAIESAATDIFSSLLRHEYEKPNASSLPFDLRRIKVEKASIDEIYIDLTKPAAILAQKLAVEGGENKSGETIGLFRKLIDESGAASTTVGGLETDEIALATNGLSKDDIRRGSSLQVLDSDKGTVALDSGSASWWNRVWSMWEPDEVLLACGSAIAARARATVSETYGGVFTLSAGISSNKTMAKLASGLKKPNRQTLINPRDDATLQKLFHPLPVGRIKGLGGKFGEEVATKLRVCTVGDIAMLPLAVISASFPDQAQFIYSVSQGMCTEEVSERTQTKSIGAGKTFRGALSFLACDHESLRKWTAELCEEVLERLEADQQDHGRYATKIGVGIVLTNRKGSISRSAVLPQRPMEACGSTVFKLARELLAEQRTGGTNKIVGLSVTATNFAKLAKGACSIQDAFRRHSEGSIKATVTQSMIAASPQRAIDCFANELSTIPGDSSNSNQCKKDKDGVPTVGQHENILLHKSIKNCGEDMGSTSDFGLSGASLHVDGKEVDMDVFSQLPPALRAEIRGNACATTTSRKRGLGLNGTNQVQSSRGLERFMVSKKQLDGMRTASRKDVDEIKRGQTSASGSHNNGPLQHQNSNSSHKIPSWNVAQPFSDTCLSNIDPEVLVELGPEVTKSIADELQMHRLTKGGHVKQKKKNHITSFFATQNK